MESVLRANLTCQIVVQYLMIEWRSHRSYMTIWKASYGIGGVFHWKCFWICRDNQFYLDISYFLFICKIVTKTTVKRRYKFSYVSRIFVNWQTHSNMAWKKKFWPLLNCCGVWQIVHLIRPWVFALDHTHLSPWVREQISPSQEYHWMADHSN